MSLVYLSRRRVELGEWTMTATVDGSTVTGFQIAPGDYYLNSAQSATSLCEAIHDALNTAFPSDSFQVTWSSTTGLLTIACITLAGNWAVTFNETTFRRWVGWGATGGWSSTSTSSQTSTEVCQGVIFASSGRAEFARRPIQFGLRQEDSISGAVAQISTGAEFRTASWAHKFEPDTYSASPLKSGTWDPVFGSFPETENTRPWTWMDFFRHHGGPYGAGQPFRVYADPGFSIADAEDTYTLLNATPFAPAPTFESSVAAWTVKIDAKTWVESA